MNLSFKPIALIPLCFALASLWCSPLQAQPTAAEYGVILNLSGKQRMLSQKMSKEVALIALNIDKTNNLSHLQKTSALFDKTLIGLTKGSAELGLPPTESKRILIQLGKLEAIWADFYPTIHAITTSGSVSDGQLSAIATQNIPLLKEMNKVVGLYENEAKKNGLDAAQGLAATINLAGKQRMLSQKMSKEFFLIALGYQVEDNKLNLLETYTLFDRTLKGLANGDETLGLPGNPPPHIRAQLNVVDELWQQFKPLVTYGAAYKTQTLSRDEISQIAELNIPLLTEMNKAVGLYEQEASH